MFKNFKDFCDYYTVSDCKGCPYDNCSSTSECEDSYNLDKDTLISKLDLLIETSAINTKLDEILRILRIKL